MFPLIDCSSKQLKELATECGFPDNYGQLVTPLTNYRIDDAARFALDNGGFSSSCPRQWENLLKKAAPFKDRCLWAVCPDVPGDAIRTMELFQLLRHKIYNAEFKLALAMQDGMENIDIPWGMLTCVFIAGTTDWKMSKHAEGIIRAAKWLGKWVHIGRINTGGRWEHFAKLGADSFDGSALAKPYPGAHRQREDISKSRNQMLLTNSHVQNAEVTGFPEIDVDSVDLE